MYKESRHQRLPDSIKLIRTRHALTPSPVNRSLRANALFVCCLCSAAILSACGSQGDDSGAADSLTTPSNSLATVDIRAGDTSPLADDIATEDLQRSASINAARGISLNTTGFQMFSRNAATASSLVRVADMLDDDPDSTIATGRRSLPQRLNDATQTSALVDVQTQQLLLATLGLDSSGNARATRDGNRITIDPDDATVCAGDTFAHDVTYTAGEQAICAQLVSAITVQLNAITEQSGTIVYLFNQQPLLSIGYGPLNASYELQLETLHELQGLSNQLSPDEQYTTKHMQGAIRLTASRDAAQNSSGSLALVVSKPLVVEDNDGSRLSMAPATLFTASHDESIGTAHLELGLGAVEVVTGAMVDAFSSASSILTMGGFSGVFDVSNHGATLVARHLGFSNGPLTLTSSDGIFSSLNLSPFGYTLNTALGELLLDSALSATLGLRSSSAETGVFSADVTLSAPAGTRMNTESSTADSVVQTGGPLNLNYSFSNSQSSENGFVSWAPGNCQSSANQVQNPDNLFSALFDCN